MSVQVNAVAAWSPLQEQPRLMAYGSVHSELQLVSLDFNAVDAPPHVVGRVPTTAPFRSLAWSPATRHAGNHPWGLLAGGLEDGTVSIWDPTQISSGQIDSLSQVSKHEGAVTALQFNPNKESSHLLASGGADGNVWIIALNDVTSPGVFSPGTTPSTPGNAITSLAWNTTASYIIAAGSQDGHVTVWDLKQKKPCFEVGVYGPISALSWSPQEGFLLMTASSQSSLIHIWDLRASNTVPLIELNGHHGGILSASWSSHDAGLLISSGTDNRTLVWDLKTRQVVSEFYSFDPLPPLYNIHFACEIPGLVSSTAQDGTVYVNSASLENGVQHVLKWLPIEEGSFHQPKTTQYEEIPPVHEGINLPHESPAVVQNAAPEPPHTSFEYSETPHEPLAQSSYPAVDASQEVETNVTLQDSNQQQNYNSEEYMVPTHAHANSVCDLRSAADALDEKSAEDFCDWKLTQTNLSEADRQTWSFLKILFEQDARKQLLVHLGFDGVDHIHSASVVDAPIESGPLPSFTTASENAVKRSLLVGNFEAAVDICLENNQLANALLLATCGGPELWHRTQEAFFKIQTRPFMKIVAAIIKNELDTLVLESDPASWKETLAILSTYSKSDEFPGLCDQLAWRLFANGDIFSASLCFICAMNLEKTLEIWTQLEPPTNDFALQSLIEKVQVLANGTGQPSQTPYHAQYAILLSKLDKPDIAKKYGKIDKDIQQPARIQLQPLLIPALHAESKPVEPSPDPPGNSNEVTPPKQYEHYSAPIPSPNESLPPASGLDSSTIHDQHTSNDEQVFQHSLTEARENPSMTDVHEHVHEPQANQNQPPPVLFYSPSNPVVNAAPISTSSTQGQDFAQDVETIPFERTPQMKDISDEDIVIVKVFVELLGIIERQKLSTGESKQLAEAIKAKDLLVAKLNGADMSDTVLESVRDMAHALQRRDFKAAQQVHVALSSSHWALHKEWLRGLKGFFQLCLKRLK